jgi:hypothetical protein
VRLEANPKRLGGVATLRGGGGVNKFLKIEDDGGSYSNHISKIKMWKNALVKALIGCLPPPPNLDEVGDDAVDGWVILWEIRRR